MLREQKEGGQWPESRKRGKEMMEMKTKRQLGQDHEGPHRPRLDTGLCSQRDRRSLEVSTEE